MRLLLIAAASATPQILVLRNENEVDGIFASDKVQWLGRIIAQKLGDRNKKH